VKYRARYTPEAASIIQKLNPDVKRRVRAAVDGLLDSPLAGHALHDELSGLRSFRMGRMGKHRIVYRINDRDRVLEFLLVGLRRDIYQELRERLLKGLDTRSK
jgi:mRNA-degrading endonuclease RelE of RelBE toxin-antitoxin system